jgi:hypothetical protein
MSDGSGNRRYRCGWFLFRSFFLLPPSRSGGSGNHKCFSACCHFYLWFWSGCRRYHKYRFWSSPPDSCMQPADFSRHRHIRSSFFYATFYQYFYFLVGKSVLIIIQSIVFTQSSPS